MKLARSISHGAVSALDSLRALKGLPPRAAVAIFAICRSPSGADSSVSVSF